MPVSRTAKATRPAPRRGRRAATTSPALGELERVREQVLQDLVQPLRVGLDALGRAGLDRGGEAPGPSAAASGCEALHQRVDACARPARGSGASSMLAGLDLRQVEDVVDQRQQVVARGGDGLRELAPARRVRLPSLLSASSLARISDELSGVRSSWLMLARNSLLYWFARSSSSRPLRRARPAPAPGRPSAPPAAASAPRAGRWSAPARPAGLEPRLRSLQRAALLLQLLVADAQLLLLRLQLLRLALRLLQQLLEPRAVLRGAHRDARAAPRRGRAARRSSGLHAAEEAELDHRLHHAVDRGGRDQQLARLAPRPSADETGR